MNISVSYIFSFCNTINVLSSQAYGAKNYKLVSEWYQLGCFLSIFLIIPPAITYLYTEQLLIIFGANAHIAHLAGIYAKYSIISILPQTQFCATEMYFQSQSNVIPIVVVCSCMIVVNFMTNLVLVFGYLIPNWNGLGFIGSPISTAITAIIQYFVYILYMFVYKEHHSKTWSSFKQSTFSWQRINKFLSVAIPQTISQALEEWQIQIITLFTSKLDEVAIAAFASLNMIILILHCFAIGLCDAVSVKVGNALGSNMPNYAKYISWITIIIAVIIGVIVGGTLAAFGKYLYIIFSFKEEMYHIFKQICPMVGACYFMLNLLSALIGILLGQARPVGLAVFALIACWGVSVPLSYMLGVYLKRGDFGIYISLIVGYTLYTIGTLILFFMSDWNKCALDAVERSKEDREDIKEKLLIN